MNKKTNDLWFNIYVFLLLPFCVLINIWNLIGYIKHFDSLNNMFITIIQLILCVTSIIFYNYTFYYAKYRVKKSYLLIMISIFLSVIVASFNQTLNTYYDQGAKTYLMFLVYVALFVIWWGLPNYIYFERRKEMYILEKKVDKELLKSKIKEAVTKKKEEENK